MRRAQGVWVLLALLAALVAAGPAAASHDFEHPFSGVWEMQFSATDPGVLQGRANTATVVLKARDKATYDAARATFSWGGWLPLECSQNNARDFYVGEFKRDADGGPLVACVNPGSSILKVVFKSTQYAVEGAITTSGGPGAYGTFPSQPSETFNSFTFLRHLPDDGAKPEEVSDESLCPSRTPAARSGAAQAVCKLDRVVFLDGSNVVRGEATSKRAVVGQRVFFLARVTSRIVPADLVLLFPKEVPRANIEVVPEAQAGGAGCGSVKTHPSGKQYLVCTIDRAKSRVLVGVVMPKALNGTRLEVLLAVGKPTSPGQRREWIAKQKLAVDVDVEVVQPKPVAVQPAAPAAARDPIEGHWVGFVPKPRQLPGTLEPLDPAPLVPDADVRITKGRDGQAIREDLFATSKGSKVDLYLNEPRSTKYPSGAASLVYEGTVWPRSSASGVTAQLELIVPGQKAVAFPQVCLGVAEQAKAPILCGLVESQRIVLKRVSD